MVLNPNQIEYIDNKYALAGYPKSHFFTVGYELYLAGHIDAAVDAYQRGADNVGCVPCMDHYMIIQQKRGNLYLLLPYAFEGAIRGHMPCMDYLVSCYNSSEPAIANALSNFWVKLRNELGVTTGTTEEGRKEIKKMIANFCCVCEKEDSKHKVFKKCGICKYYSYCGKDCQTYQWKEQNHMGECRQLKILRTCCKPKHVREIRDAIMNGDNPKDIPRLQNLRTALGLNRPKEEYEELLLRLGDDSDSTIQDQYTYLTARKDGTVHIGSTPNAI